MLDDPLDPQLDVLSEESFENREKKLTDAAQTRQMAWVLTIAGAIPFVALTLALMFLGKTHPLQGDIVSALVTYGAAILSFLGGIRWGVAMRSPDADEAKNTIAWSVVTCLVGWFSLFLPVPYVIGVQIIAFAAQGTWDSFAAQYGAFGLWFAKLRITITFIVVLTLVAAFFATV